jgi:hypothetical protein
MFMIPELGALDRSLLIVKLVRESYEFREKSNVYHSEIP